MSINKFSLFLQSLDEFEKNVSLLELRKRLLKSLLTTGTWIGLVLYVIGLTPFVFGKLTIWYPIIYTIIIAWLLAITFIKALSFYTLRVFSLLSFLYIMGILNLFLGGLNAGAALFFLTFTAIFTLLVGIRGGILALASSIIAITIVGIEITQGYVTPSWYYSAVEVSPWIITSLTMVLMGALLAISISTLVRSLDEQLRKAVALANDLSLAYETTRRENVYRYQLRHLGDSLHGEDSLQTRLEDGLKLLCHTLDSTGGFIATRQFDCLVVRVSLASVPVGEQFSAIEMSLEDVYKPSAGLADTLTWMAPAYKGDKQLTLIGIGHPKNKHQYSENDLDLLAEAANKVASIVALAEIYSGETVHEKSLHSESSELFTTLDSNPDPQFLKMVEDVLKKLADTITLGQSPLSQELKIKGETHIDRGKILREKLVSAIDTLRPDGNRPAEPVPHEWENYVVLHDAYVEGVANRDIMAHLYISEGTFNRIRRKALRGVSRYLLEKSN
ncbi:MAG: hypothetical protein NTW32_22260 [Chloroflexi bacterium]|nr:hypothetical protein [Chloroflexota bacterium]